MAQSTTACRHPALRRLQPLARPRGDGPAADRPAAPFPADEMEAFEVSKDVGNAKNNSPELLNSK
jgi:hypothetical protein